MTLWYSWDDSGNPVICTYAGDVRTILRPATDADWADLMNGRLREDRPLNPTNQAWDHLARQGG